MLRIVFCDDEPNTVKYYENYLADLLKQRGVSYTADSFTDSGKLLSLLYTGYTWDVYFLDIDMPMVNGLNLGKKIREVNPDAYLIYLSIHRELVFDTFENRAFRFLPKDEFHSRIEECVDSLLKDMKREDQVQMLTLDSGGKLYRYGIDVIQYIKSTDKYVEITLQDGTTSEAIRYKITDLEEQLNAAGFIRVHRSYLVNYKYIRSIRPAQIVMDDGTVIPISRYRAEAIRQTFRALTM